MGKISLKVEIAGRTYPLTVLDSEEKTVLKAVEDINKAVALLKTNYAVSDSQDLLAMSSFSLKVGLEFSKNQLTNSKLSIFGISNGV